MRHGSLSEKAKELKQAIIILSADELSLLITACDEYQKNHPKTKKIKELLLGLNEIPVF